VSKYFGGSIPILRQHPDLPSYSVELSKTHAIRLAQALLKAAQDADETFKVLPVSRSKPPSGPKTIPSPFSKAPRHRRPFRLRWSWPSHRWRLFGVKWKISARFETYRF
jgi:hypothetical protein